MRFAAHNDNHEIVGAVEVSDSITINRYMPTLIVDQFGRHWLRVSAPHDPKNFHYEPVRAIEGHFLDLVKAEKAGRVTS